MGYTHYFTQKRHATEEEWAKITHAFRELYLNNNLPDIVVESDVPSPPLIDKDSVVFNGVGDDGHETMALERKGEIGKFEFCKTACKPYDTAVTALLALCHYYAPDAWEIRSDGGPLDWRPGLEAATTAIEAPVGSLTPPSIQEL